MSGDEQHPSVWPHVLGVSLVTALILYPTVGWLSLPLAALVHGGLVLWYTVCFGRLGGGHANDGAVSVVILAVLIGALSFSVGRVLVLEEAVRREKAAQPE